MFTKEKLDKTRLEVYNKSKNVFNVELSLDEEMKYIAFYGNKLVESGVKIGFNRFQRFTALALFQRVYLKRSIWEIPPPLTMIISLFIVSKFNYDTTISSLLASLGFGSDFDRQFKVEEQMPQIEIEILEAIDFKLKVYLPFHQVTALCKGKPFEDKQELCNQYLFNILQTDALFLFTPGQIALAAVANVVGIEEAINTVSDFQIPDDINLCEIINEINQMKPMEVTDDEIQSMEQTLGPEYGIFHIIKNETIMKNKMTSPTTLIP